MLHGEHGKKLLSLSPSLYDGSQDKEFAFRMGESDMS